MLGRHDTDDTVTPSPVSSLSNGTTGLVDVCTMHSPPLWPLLKRPGNTKTGNTKNQEYTVISWDWGYSLFPFPFPIPIPITIPNRLTI